MRQLAGFFPDHSNNRIRADFCPKFTATLSFDDGYTLIVYINRASNLDIPADFSLKTASIPLGDGDTMVAYHNRTTNFNIPKQSCMPW